MTLPSIPDDSTQHTSLMTLPSTSDDSDTQQEQSRTRVPADHSCMQHSRGENRLLISRSHFLPPDYFIPSPCLTLTWHPSHEHDGVNSPLHCTQLISSPRTAGLSSQTSVTPPLFIHQSRAWKKLDVIRQGACGRVVLASPACTYRQCRHCHRVDG